MMLCAIVGQPIPPGAGPVISSGLQMPLPWSMVVDSIGFSSYLSDHGGEFNVETIATS